jgi:hypothetical protein
MSLQKKHIASVAAGLLVAFGLVAALTRATSAHGQGSARAAGSPSLPPFVPAVAQRMAAIAGNARPDSAEYVYTTRQAAVGLDGEVVDSNQPVYLVVLHGHFVYRYARGIGPPPTGTVLTLTIDAATGDSLDLGLGNGPSGAARLGPVRPLALGR